MPSQNIVVEFIRRSDPIKDTPISKTRNLYNIRLQDVEDKNKLMKLLPPIPDWAKKLPPKPEPKIVEKPISKPIEKVKVTEKVEVKKSKNSVEEPKKIVEKEDESEEEEDSDSSNEEEEEESSDEEEGELDSSEDEEEIKPEKNKVSKEKPIIEEEKEFITEPEKVDDKTTEQKIKEGYTENLTEEEKLDREKRSILRKWKQLVYRLKQKATSTEDAALMEKVKTLPSYTEFDDINIVKKGYEEEVFELKIIANTQKYKKMIVFASGAIETMSSTFGFEIFDKYTQFQLTCLDQYDEILMELGEQNHNSWLNNMSPEMKLITAMGMNTAQFIMAKSMGRNANDFMSLMMGKSVQKTPLQPSPKAHLD